jgi:hypothetical protein
MRTCFALIALGLAGACVSAPAPAEGALGWMDGCWETEDGDYREVWRREGDHLFGFAVAYKGGAEVFFEQTRIDLGPPSAFNAYPAGRGPTAFAQAAREGQSVSFLNVAHDYPQAISYVRKGTRLSAVIALADGTKVQTFEFEACAK